MPGKNKWLITQLPNDVLFSIQNLNCHHSQVIPTMPPKAWKTRGHWRVQSKFLKKSRSTGTFDFLVISVVVVIQFDELTDLHKLV